jgi:hypothetical protein
MAVTFAVYEELLGDAFVFVIPKLALVLRVFFLAVLPVIVGASWRSIHPASASRVRPWIRGVCVWCIAVLLVYVVANQWEQVIAETVSSVVAAIAFLSANLAVGWWAGRGMGMTTLEKASAAFLIGVRNLGMMAAVAIVMLGRTDYAVFGAVYFLVQVLLALALIRWTLRRAPSARALNQRAAKACSISNTFASSVIIAFITASASGDRVRWARCSTAKRVFSQGMKRGTTASSLRSSSWRTIFSDTIITLSELATMVFIEVMEFTVIDGTHPSIN